MTIREKGYIHWDGVLKERKLAWWPITRLGIKLAFKKKYFRFIYFGSFIPALAFIVGIYISERIEDFRYLVKGSSKILEVNPAYFKTYFTGDFLLFMMIMILVVAGAGLISDDLKYNSLQLYFSRPVQKKDYLIGKAAIILFFLLLLTLVPGLLFIIFKLLFSGSFRFIVAYPWLPVSVIVFSLFVSLFFCLYTLLLSSLSKNKRYVSILIFVIYILSEILFGVFYENFRKPAFALFSLKANLQQFGAFLFRQNPAFGVAWYWSFLLLLGICALAYFVLKSRVKGVDIIK
jgi:ABC-type transport system involved in multi-copper enzyme maturation permease subunit